MAKPQLTVDFRHQKRTVVFAQRHVARFAKCSFSFHHVSSPKKCVESFCLSSLTSFGSATPWPEKVDSASVAGDKLSCQILYLNDSFHLFLKTSRHYKHSAQRCLDSDFFPMLHMVGVKPIPPWPTFDWAEVGLSKIVLASPWDFHGVKPFHSIVTMVGSCFTNFQRIRNVNLWQVRNFLGLRALQKPFQIHRVFRSKKMEGSARRPHRSRQETMVENLCSPKQTTCLFSMRVWIQIVYHWYHGIQYTWYTHHVAVSNRLLPTAPQPFHTDGRGNQTNKWSLMSEFIHRTSWTPNGSQEQSTRTKYLDLQWILAASSVSCFPPGASTNLPDTKLFCENQPPAWPLAEVTNLFAQGLRLMAAFEEPLCIPLKIDFDAFADLIQCCLTGGRMLFFFLISQD